MAEDLDPNLVIVESVTAKRSWRNGKSRKGRKVKVGKLTQGEKFQAWRLTLGVTMGDLAVRGKTTKFLLTMLRYERGRVHLSKLDRIRQAATILDARDAAAVARALAKLAALTDYEPEGGDDENRVDGLGNN